MEAKRSRVDDRMGEESSSEDDMDMDINDLENVKFNMELKGLPIEEVDYHGIKQLLAPLLPSSGMNLAEVSDDIIKQNFIGHVIKQVDEVNQFADDEDPVLSLTTLLPLKDQPWRVNLNKLLTKKLEAEKSSLSSAQKQNFEECIKSSGGFGWFVNSRFLNFPARAEGLMSLIEDLAEAEKKKHKTNWKFDKIMMVVPRLHPKPNNEETTEIIFRHQEDELLIQAAECTFEWNAEQDLRQDEQGSGWDEDELMTEYRMIAILKYEKFKEYVNMLPVWLTTQ